MPCTYEWTKRPTHLCYEPAKRPVQCGGMGKWSCSCAKGQQEREGGQRREAREERAGEGKEAGEAKRGEEVVVLCEVTRPVNASRAPPDDV